MEEAKKIGNIDRNFNLIDSALKELEGVCERSFSLFENVLTNAQRVLQHEENEKCSPSSDFASRQERILARIIEVTNKYIDLNNRCDL